MALGRKYLLTSVAPELLEEIESGGVTLRTPIPWFLRIALPRGVAAITFGRTVLISSQWIHWSEDRLEDVVRHELVHVEQYRRLGFLRFLLSYLGEYRSHRSRGLNPDVAYREISFEREARSRERSLKDLEDESPRRG